MSESPVCLRAFCLFDLMGGGVPCHMVPFDGSNFVARNRIADAWTRPRGTRWFKLRGDFEIDRSSVSRQSYKQLEIPNPTDTNRAKQKKCSPNASGDRRGVKLNKGAGMRSPGISRLASPALLRCHPAVRLGGGAAVGTP